MDQVGEERVKTLRGGARFLKEVNEGGFSNKVTLMMTHYCLSEPSRQGICSKLLPPLLPGSQVALLVFA